MKAAEHLLEMRRRTLTPTVKSFNTVIHACARVGDHKAAEQWLSEMQREQLRPTQFSYSNAAWSSQRPRP